MSVASSYQIILIFSRYHIQVVQYTLLTILLSSTKEIISVSPASSLRKMIIFSLSLFLLAAIQRSALGASISVTQQSLMDDIVGVWSQFRDPDTGFWCDTLRFTSGTGQLSIFCFCTTLLTLRRIY